MILDLSLKDQTLTLTGENFGCALTTEELTRSLRFLFSNWYEPVLDGRGVLHLLQRVAQGVSSPRVVYGPMLLKAADCLPQVLRLIAVGNIAPRLIAGRAQWLLTTIPAGEDAPLCNALADTWMRTCASTPLTRAQARKQDYRIAEDAWLSALRAPQAQAIDDKTLARHIDMWIDPLFEGRRGALPVKPRHSPEGWWLDIDAPKDETGFHSPEVLRLLGQAIGIAPLLALPQPWDENLFLRFLREAVPALRAAAFDITLPEALEASVPEVRETALNIEDGHVKIAQTIVFAGLELSIAEAQAILDAGESLAFIQGEWRYVDLDALRQALEARGPELRSCHGALPLLLAGALRIAPTAQDVQNFLREMTHPPEGDLPLREVLRTYQAQGVCWLMQAYKHRLGVCLADDMGLGKTLQTIAFLLSQHSTVKKPALVIAPLTVLPVWEREFAHWAPQLKVLRFEGPSRLRNEAFQLSAPSYDVVLTAYGYLWRDYNTLHRVEWSTLVLDEAQQIKNPSTRQSQAARSLHADFRLALTGTPIENRLDDLWSLLDFLNPELFGPRRDFAKRYADPDKLRRAVANFLLRRLKSDPAILPDLPPKIQQEHYAQLSEAQASAYDYALADYARDVRMLPPSERPGAALVLLMRLKEICDHPALTEGEGDDRHWLIEDSGKLLILLSLLDEILAQGESVLIFTQFARMGAFLQKVLTERLGRRVAYIHGGLSMKKRKAEIESFSNDPAAAPMVLSLRTGAFGLTLTKANHVVHFDRWWNPAVEAQATDRAHRIGQKRTVVVHHIVCRGTLEDRIEQILRDKQSLAEDIIAPTSAARLARLPAETLLSLLKR
ncbi:MAG: SNF2-related protein [bacterium]|nr:SNF2-related protein [bacterium]